MYRRNDIADWMFEFEKGDIIMQIGGDIKYVVVGTTRVGYRLEVIFDDSSSRCVSTFEGQCVAREFVKVGHVGEGEEYCV